MPKIRRYILALAIAAVLAAFLLWPIAQVVREAFYERGRATGYWLASVFTDPSVREWLLNAFKVALATTAVTTVIALPLALIADKVNFRGKALASALLMAPMILPPFVGALAYLKLFARDWGSVNLILDAIGLPKVDFLGAGGFRAVVILESLHLYPILYLNCVAALANIDPAMGEAARNLGASRWRVLRTITLPLMLPGLFAGLTIVFIWSFCELGTPLMVNYDPILPKKIYDGLQELDTPTKTFAMVFVMLAASVAMYATGRAVFTLLGRGGGAMVSRGGAGSAVKKAGLGVSLACWAAFGLVTAVAALPHAGVILMSVSDRWDDSILPTGYTLRHLGAVFRDEQTWESILNSLRYAGSSTVLCALLGVAVSYLVVRLKIRGAWALDSTSMLPLAVPGLVMAAGYVAITLPGSPLEAIGPTRNPTVLLVIAYSIRRLPYMVRSVSAGLQQTSETLEEAARNLGASRFGAVARITVPLVMSNILAGGILAFSFNMLEVSDSLILAQTTDYYPITKQLFVLAGIGQTKNQAAALGVYGMALLAGTLLLANMLLGKKMGQLFRV